MKKTFTVVAYANGVVSGHTGKFLEIDTCGHWHKTLEAATLCQDKLAKNGNPKWGFSRIEDNAGKTVEPAYEVFYNERA